ncbi:uncharacterized protein KGF55_003831 [Candida pseudojiufengensis]|uniref:uncharacterized protein n=1 Tax=Candida pseudojiufengensis TaxID=497109 RepID=UPI0022255FCD|nr:uncharacterized protein KGF55_003831 [Candida pseudojiufengensis]KAI5961860.1 hypothetical protein KGF55_003831 [Candida pseudojiufengensis]
MFRKRPPQITVEELQQTYNDCCNETIKNLTLEEDNNVDDALKGWKSLHTTLLYKLDLFEKCTTKLDSEEKTLLNELKGIRDENVKHLIRVQLRLDEKNRRLKREKEGYNQAPPSPPPRAVREKTIPSLRISSPQNSSNSHISNQRSMMKSLRPHSNGQSTPKASPTTTNLKPTSVQQASQAASKSWVKPSIKKFEVSTPPKVDVTSYFADFDQDTYTTNNTSTNNNWEKYDSRSSSGLSETSSNANLIDIDEDIDLIREKETINPDSNSLSRSMDDLTIKPVSESPPRTTKPKNGLNVPSIEHISKSTSDVRTKTKQPYIYNKPKPLNLQKLMQQSQTNKTKPKSNITYNYVKSTNPSKKVLVKSKPLNTNTTTNGNGHIKKNVVKKQEVEENMNSPTMDDLLSGYDDATNGNDEPLTEPTITASLTDPKQQDKLIASIRGIDPQAAKNILNDVVVHGDEVYWDDIVGLENAKNSLKEAVVYPFLRPDLFKGLREPTRGMLLFGPPGTGKTMLARAVATESQSTFFSISSSSLTSKYLGESEKLVKALFLLAKKLAPSIVFMDEIDSLLSSRTEGEVESTRRIKNEFLIQWSELSSAAAGRESNEDVSRVLILGATNLPWSIDEAARRRFVRRQYIPLPEDEARKSQIIKLLKYQKHTLSNEDYENLIKLTEGFSGSDMTALAKDSAMGPLRSLGDKLLSTPTDQIRPISLEDFENSLKYIRPSVSKEGLQQYEDWADKFGSSGA